VNQPALCTGRPVGDLFAYLGSLAPQPVTCVVRPHKMRMDIQDVPEVFGVPQLGPNEESPVAVADMVLTALLRRESGLLNAEHRDSEPGVGLFIGPLGSHGEQMHAPVVVSPSRGAFRSVLARFGHHYMGGQLCHGYALRFLRQAGQVHRCHIYMSNTGQSGFWIKIYAVRMAEPDAPPNS
jgi:hypothetical protein